MKQIENECVTTPTTMKPSWIGAENRILAADRTVHNWYRFVLSFPPHLVRDYLKGSQMLIRNEARDDAQGTEVYTNGAGGCCTPRHRGLGLRSWEREADNGGCTEWQQ
jgi:hypothetical protein